MSTKKTSKTKKLKITKETVKDLNAGTGIQGGRLPESKHTYCGGDGCYKPNPY